MRLIRMLVGAIAAVMLAPVAAQAPARARSTDAGVDPAVLAAFRSAVTASYYTAWARDGGTYTDRCIGRELGRTSAVIALDVKTRTKLHKYRGESGPPSTWYDHGHTLYDKVPAAVRKSLRVHGVRPPARWVRSHNTLATPGRHDSLDQGDEIPFEVE